MPIYSPTGYLDITNATLRTSNIETSNIKIGSANLFITTGNVSDEVFQFTNVTTGLVTTGNVEIGGSITAPDGVTDIKSNLIVEGNVEAAALRLNSVSISPVYTIASGSGTIDFQGAPTSLTASANIEVTGNVIAHQFHGDGSGLTGIPPTAITGTLSQWEGTDEIYFNGNVGIANTNPGYDLNVGSNLFVDDDGSNVLVVDGNVSATYFEGDGSKLTGLVTTLESVANIGNSTTNVIQFTNETTGFVTDANAVIGSNLTISGLTAQKVPYVDAQKVLRDSYITTSTGLTSIDSNLSVTGNMFVYGERFFIESESQLLKDPIIGLANNNVDQNIDIGILMQRPTSNVGIIHHGGTNELTLGYTQSNLTASEIINDLSQELTVNVIGNVVTQNNLSVGGTLTINTISAASSHSLSAVSNVGNTTSNTVQFTNPTTSLVASGNVEVGGNVVAGYLYGDGSNVTGISSASNLQVVTDTGNVTSNTVQFTNATTGLVTTANVEVGGELTVSGMLNLPRLVGDPSSGVTGDIYFHTTSSSIRYYNGTAWGSLMNAPPVATGSTVIIPGQSAGTSLTYNLGIDFEDDQDSDTQLTYTLSSGTLPTGISLPSPGSSTTSGTLTLEPGTFNFTVQATDTGNQSSLQNYQYTGNDPIISSFSGFSRVHADYAGQVMSLTGTNFVGTMSVQFKGADNTTYNGTSLSVTSTTNATITLPALPLENFPYTVRINGLDSSTTLSSFIKGFTTTGSTTITMPAFTMNFWVMGGGGSGGGSHYTGGGAGYISYSSTARPAGNTVIRVAPASTQSAVQNSNIKGFNGNVSSPVYGHSSAPGTGHALGGKGGGYVVGEADGSSGGGGGGSIGFGGAGGSGGSDGAAGNTYAPGTGMTTSAHTLARNNLATALATAYPSGTSVTSGSGGAASSGSHQGGGGGGGIVITFPGITVADVALAGVLHTAGSHLPGQPGVGFGAGGGSVGYNAGTRGSTGRGASGVVFIWN
jgi:hypothetical protein